MFKIILEGLSNINLQALFVGLPLVALWVFLWFRLTRPTWTAALGKPAHRPTLLSQLLAIGLLLVVLAHLGVLVNPDMTAYDQSYGKLLIFTGLLIFSHSLIMAMNYVFEKRSLRYWLLTELPLWVGVLGFGLIHAAVYQSQNPEIVQSLRWDFAKLLDSVPWLAVGIGYGVFQVLGLLWYSPVLFGKIWMQEMGMTAEQVGKGPGAKGLLLNLAFTAVAFLLLTLFFAQTVYGFLGAILVGPPVALIHAALVGVTTAYEGRSWKAWFIKAVYPAVGIIIFALVFGQMR